MAAIGMGSGDELDMGGKMNRFVLRCVLSFCAVVLGILSLTGCSQIDKAILMNQDEGWKYYYEQSTHGDYDLGVDMAKQPIEAVVNKLINQGIISADDVEEGHYEEMIFDAPYTFKRPGLEYCYWYMISHENCYVSLGCTFRPIANSDTKAYSFSIQVIRQQTASEEGKPTIETEKFKPFFDVMMQTIQDRAVDSGVNCVTFHDIIRRYSADDLNERIQNDYAYPTSSKNYREVQDRFDLSNGADDAIVRYSLTYVPGDHDVYDQVNGEQVKYRMMIEYYFKLNDCKVVID